jgi:peptidoglycan hydrolase-like protein with peptidoglycan-binding domain
VKKIIILLSLLFLPTLVFASIDQNIYYGLMHNSKVTELQQFLINKGFLTGKATGNYLSLTVSAVKKYQASKNINPTGYTGPLTRQAINSDLLPVQQNPGSTTSPVTQVPLTGLLSLAQTSSYSSKTVVAPQLNFKLGDFSLTNNTTEAINFKTIEADMAIGPDIYAINSFVTNLYVTYGGDRTVIVNGISSKNFFTVNFNLPAGQTINLSVYGDVNSVIPLNSIITSSLLASGKTAVSSANISTNAGAILVGQNITFGTGSLTVSQDSSTPVSKIVAVNQRVVAGKFQFTSTNDSYTIYELKFVFPAYPEIPVVLNAVLSDADSQATYSVKPIPVTYGGQNYVLDFNTSIQIPANSSKSLTLYYDLIESFDSRSTNMNVAPILAYVKVKNGEGFLRDGVAANYNISSYNYGGIILPAGGVTVNALYPFKSIPTVTAIPLVSVASNGFYSNLYTYSISADLNGDISIKQLTFTITLNGGDTSNPNFNNFKLFKGNNDYTGSVSIGNIINDNYIGVTAINGVGTGITNKIVVTFIDEEKIPAGKTQTYTLKALANNFVSGVGSASITVPTDIDTIIGGNFLLPISINVYYGLAQTPNDLFAIKENFLWSDRSEGPPNPHNDFNGNYTKDWYNGFNVLSLPLATQTITAK